MKMPKKPKKPRASSSIAAWERFAARHREWVSKCHKIKSDKKRKESLIKRYSQC